MHILFVAWSYGPQIYGLRAIFGGAYAFSESEFQIGTTAGGNKNTDAEEILRITAKNQWIIF